MAQTYSQFKTFVLQASWRPNDTELASDLDNIIRMANSELGRKLNIQRREVSADIAPETEDFPLPGDFQQIMSLTDTQGGHRQRKMQLTSKAQIDAMRANTNSAYTLPYYYVQRGESANTLYLVGPFSASNPGSFALTYRTGIPDYQATDTSWVEEDYLDLYLYTVLKHTGMWTREDDRIQFYSALMADALASAMDEDLRLVRFGGSPLHMNPTRHVPQTRRR